MQLEHTRRILRSIHDHPSEIEKCVDLLYLLQKKQGLLVEVVTVLKYEKPLLHSLLKNRIKNNPGLSMLFEISMEYELAKNSLELPKPTQTYKSPTKP